MHWKTFYSESLLCICDRENGVEWKEKKKRGKASTKRKLAMENAAKEKVETKGKKDRRNRLQNQ